MVVRVIGIRSTLSQLDKDIESEVNRLLTGATRSSVRDVRVATPVDTGQARRGWEQRRGPNKITGDLTLNSFIVQNDVSYIEHLNQGTSTQAPSRFIESTFLRYFDEVEVEVYDNEGT